MLIRTLLFSVICTTLATAQTATKPVIKPAPKPTAVSTNSTALINTTAGTLTCKLFDKETPMTVANFIGLASGTRDWKNPVSHATKHGVPLYDGTIFHRVIPEFMIQGGDPAGNGAGDPGYSFQDEFVSTLKFDRPGRLAMANSGPNTNGSQFFITEDSAHSLHLSGRHTIFGQCDDASILLVKKIARLPRDPAGDRPFRPVKIIHITILKPGAAPPAAAHPVAKPMTKSTTKPSAQVPAKQQ
jgi:peptidyl-prolyl cis-trans isomerase A (cyclophilin A)